MLSFADENGYRDDTPELGIMRFKLNAHGRYISCGELDSCRLWTNGQIEKVNGVIKDTRVKRFHYDSHYKLWQHMADYINAYNFGRRLKTLRGRKPNEFKCKISPTEPEGFMINAIPQMTGLTIEMRTKSSEFI
jgi:hypothetical protein